MGGQKLVSFKVILGNPRSSLYLEEGQKHKIVLVLVLHATWNMPRGSHNNKNLLLPIIPFHKVSS